MLLALGRAHPFHGHHARFLRAALCHTQKRAKAKALHLARAHDLDLDAKLFECLAAFCHFSGCQHIGRFGNQIARQENTIRDGLHRREGGLGLGGFRRCNTQAFKLWLVFFLFRGAVAVEAIAPQPRTHGNTGSKRRRQPIRRNHRVPFLLHGNQGGTACILGPRRIKRIGLAKPDGDNFRQARARRPQRAGLALGPLELRRFQPARDRAAGCFLGGLGQARKRGPFSQQQNQGAAARQSGLHEGDIGHGGSCGRNNVCAP